MAERVILVCDLCPTETLPAEEVTGQTVAPPGGGAPVHLDLCPSHRRDWETLTERLGEFLAAARPLTPAPRTRTRDRGEDLAPLRAWATEHGFTIGARGRIPPDVRAAYDAAHPAGADRAGGAVAEGPPAVTILRAVDGQQPADA